MRRFYVALLVITALIFVAVFVVWLAAPQTTQQQAAGAEHANCLRNVVDECLVIPAVTGVDLDNQTVALPDALSGTYNLIVMPFDREQQVLAETWLPFFQELTQTYADTAFYNIAALPDLNAGVRLLVIGGMSVGVNEPEIRQQIAILFLEDQQAFLDALEVDDTRATQVFIVDDTGLVFWRGAGVYDEILGQALRDGLDQLIHSAD